MTNIIFFNSNDHTCIGTSTMEEKISIGDKVMANDGTITLIVFASQPIYLNPFDDIPTQFVVCADVENEIKTMMNMATSLN